MSVLTIKGESVDGNGVLTAHECPRPPLGFPAMIPRHNNPVYADTWPNVDPLYISPPTTNPSSLVSTPQSFEQGLGSELFTITPSTDAFQATFCAQSAQWENGLPILPPGIDYDSLIQHYMLSNSEELVRASSSVQHQHQPLHAEYYHTNAPLVTPSPLNMPLMLPRARETPNASARWEQRQPSQPPKSPKSRAFRKENLMSSVPLRRSARHKLSIDYNLSTPLTKHIDSPPSTPRRASRKRSTQITRKARPPRPVGAFTCSECPAGVSFSRHADLIRHQQSSAVHARERPFVCPKCLKGFTRADALGRHKQTCRAYWATASDVAGKPST